MEKLVFILEHCSTGGMPSYVLKQIESFKDLYDISVIEVNYYGHYEVQRSKIKALVDFHSLKGDKDQLPALVAALHPAIIHFQEVPEHFLSTTVLQSLFRDDRDYFIVATTHSSSTDPSRIAFKADRWVLVNEWSRQKFAEVFGEEQCAVWEYLIDNKVADKKSARTALGLPDDVHCVLNVGLFTPGKNQGALFEIARHNPSIHYYFVGNQAENFKAYWDPLMQDKPSNCFVMGERDDVDLFYQACDEMHFCSTLELNPLCLKEALSWGLPVKMYRLPTYLDQYDNHPLVTYIDTGIQ